MSEHAFQQLISGKTGGVFAALGRGLLWTLSLPYSGVMWLRNKAFDLGLRKTHRVSTPVVAIGNLTTGGTGKTPIVASIVKLLQDAGHRPGIVSRGYRADESGANDEKRVLEQLCPDVPHQQHPDRVSAGRKLIADSDIDVIVLDDAFQHRRIHRDLNIVLIDATNPFGFGYPLPRGLLRESPAALKRADLAVITRVDAASMNTIAEIEDTILQHNPQLKDRIVRVAFRPTGLLSQSGQHPLSEVLNKPVTVMTAIGNPGAFLNTCRRLEADIVTSMFFPDHHHYSRQDLEHVQQHAENAGAPLILTTLKDLVKVPDGFDRIMAVQIETVFEQDHGRQTVGSALARSVQDTPSD